MGGSSCHINDGVFLNLFLIFLPVVEDVQFSFVGRSSQQPFFSPRLAEAAAASAATAASDSSCCRTSAAPNSIPYERHGETLPHSALCHEGTRVALLKEIMAWSAAHDARHCRLSGRAGTGESTVARTVARRCAAEKRLGTSFFFARGGGDLASARKFVTTVAVQLAAAQPALRPHVSKAASALRNVADLAL